MSQRSLKNGSIESDRLFLRFQLAALQITLLCQMDTEVDVRASLNDLPDSLTRAYDEIYQCILNQKKSAPQLALNAFR